MTINQAIKIGDKVSVISRRSKVHGDLIGTVVAAGPDGSFGSSWVVETTALLANLGPSHAQVDHLTFRADDLEVM